VIHYKRRNSRRFGAQRLHVPEENEDGEKDASHECLCINILAESNACRYLFLLLESTQMAVPKSIHEAKGLWKGKSLLNLPFLPPGKQVSESLSSLHIDTDEHNTFATITYNWQQEGKRQEGTVLLAGSAHGKTVELGWVDSWHQNTAVMYLSGEFADDGLVKTKGSYPAGKEVWGWTIAFHHDGNELTMEMENVTPGGEAVWAVKATYTKD